MADSFHLENTFWWPVWNTRAEGYRGIYSYSRVYIYTHSSLQQNPCREGSKLGCCVATSLLHVLSRLFHALDDFWKKNNSLLDPCHHHNGNYYNILGEYLQQNNSFHHDNQPLWWVLLVVQLVHNTFLSCCTDKDHSKPLPNVDVGQQE